MPIETISAVLRHWLGESVKLTKARRLHGGMVNAVLGLSFDLPPYHAVMKITSGDPLVSSFRHEADSLEYLEARCSLPFPKVYAVGEAGEVVPEAYILLEWLPGVHLGDAAMSDTDRRDFERGFAQGLLELHSNTRNTFGSLDDSERCERWLDWLSPKINYNYETATPHLSKSAIERIGHILEVMPSVFANQGTPALVHGDLWATNILVDRTADGWKLTGLLDPGAFYADVEYELAYLEVWGTVGEAFFERYYRDRPMRKGYPIRRLYYWLNTLMLHVWLFGDREYVSRTERIAFELAELI